MNSAHGPCACAARSRSNATSCSAWWHSRSIKYSASRSSGPRRPERRPLRPANTVKIRRVQDRSSRSLDQRGCARPQGALESKDARLQGREGAEKDRRGHQAEGTGDRGRHRTQTLRLCFAPSRWLEPHLCQLVEKAPGETDHRAWRWITVTGLPTKEGPDALTFGRIAFVG